MSFDVFILAAIALCVVGDVGNAWAKAYRARHRCKCEDDE